MNFSRVEQIRQHFGIRWIMYRAWYAFRLRAGIIRREQPAIAWEKRPFSSLLLSSAPIDPDGYLVHRQTQSPTFFFDAADRNAYQPHFAQWDSEKQSPITLAEEVAKGTLRYFQQTAVDIGFPPAWHSNPFSHKNTPADTHWSRISDFAYGDIKLIWEANRFGFVYALVRAYWRTGNGRYAELFWQSIMDWRNQNPPQQGVNWKCGQEASLRAMAWIFGLYGFLHDPATTADRISALAHMLAIIGERIEGNLQYALSQQNNHGISEGMGLWTIGTLFPEFRAAARWRKKGRSVLEEQGRKLIYDDGSFSQHSVNYHRLMLHDYLWCLRLGEIGKRPFSPQLQQRIAAAGNWLYQLQAGQDGQLPYYGQNDGALILPLNNCDYQDFRPVIQAIHYLQTGKRLYSDGVWDEDLLWLFGQKALDSPVDSIVQSDFHAKDGGYYTLRAGNDMAFVRCTSFRHRPAQADMLHVDLWHDGDNIAIDAGTHSYNANEPWNNPLSGTRYHNTVTVDGLDQMERAGKFLWLPWLHGTVQTWQTSSDGQIAYWQGAHDGYGRLSSPVNHQRGIVRLGKDMWLILDRLQSRANHTYRLHWLLADVPHQWNVDEATIALNTPTGAYHVHLGTHNSPFHATLTRAAEKSADGWHAPYYNTKIPALSLALYVDNQEATFWSLFSPNLSALSVNDDSIIIEDEGRKVTIGLKTAVSPLLIDSINMTNNKVTSQLTI